MVLHLIECSNGSFDAMGGAAEQRFRNIPHEIHVSVQNTNHFVCVKCYDENFFETAEVMSNLQLQLSFWS